MLCKSRSASNYSSSLGANDGWLSPLQPEMNNYSLTSFWTKTEIHGGMWWVCSCWGSRRWAAKAPPGPIEVRWKVQLGSGEYVRSYFPVCIYICINQRQCSTCYNYIYWIHCNIYKLQHQTTSNWILCERKQTTFELSAGILGGLRVYWKSTCTSPTKACGDV